MDTPYSIFEQIEGTFYIIGGILASILLGLSINAYLKSRAKRILYAAIAFAFFSINLFFEASESFFPVLDSSLADAIFASILTLVLILFFLAIVKK